MREKAQQFLTEALGMDFPYVKMGKIDSLDLFGPTELMILQLYKHNKNRWKHVLDIGANLGLHSIIMDRLGWYVRAYEPQPDIFKLLERNLKANQCKNVISYQSAVHTASGEANMVVVENNLTGSHLEGFKDSYGPRHTIKVHTLDCRKLWTGQSVGNYKYPDTDFVKIDSEGNEADLCLTMTKEVMSHMDCIMEVRNEKNAQIIYDYFTGIGVPIWTQKNDWQKAQSIEDMPKMNREGSIFVGHKSPF